MRVLLSIAVIAVATFAGSAVAQDQVERSLEETLRALKDTRARISQIESRQEHVQTALNDIEDSVWQLYLEDERQRVKLQKCESCILQILKRLDEQGVTSGQLGTVLTRLDERVAQLEKESAVSKQVLSEMSAVLLEMAEANRRRSEGPQYRLRPIPDLNGQAVVAPRRRLGIMTNGACRHGHLIVGTVQPDGYGAALGLRPGDHLATINDTKVSTAADVVQVLEMSQRTARLTWSRAGQSFEGEIEFQD